MRVILPVLLILATAMVVAVSAQIGGELGYYDISSTPAGASVTFDGTPQGTTPVSVAVSSTGTPGHSIIVSRAGYQTWTQFYSGNPAPGQHITVHAPLIPVVTTPIPGSQIGFYRVLSVPEGGTVVFDGVDYGLTPVTILVSTTGTPGHTITVTRSGYESWSRFFAGNPAPNQVIDVVATLVPVNPTGNIYVSSRPEGAVAVLDNGLESLVTPGTFRGITPGFHNVRVSWSGFLAYSTTIRVLSGETSTVSADLAPAGETGSLSITSVPAGAGLYVDSVYEGLTSQVIGNLAAGTHTVTLVKSGYQDFTQAVTIRGGEISYLSTTLSPLVNPSTGDLEISSVPSASVYLDNEYKGETSSSGPLYVTRLAPGTYTVLLKKTGYTDYTTTAQIMAGTTASVSVALQPASPAPMPGADIYSQPSGADVYINNAYVGITPLSLDAVNITGPYTVGIRLAGYAPYTSSGTISPGQNVVINAALAPLAAPTTKAPLDPSLLIATIAAAIAFPVIVRVVRRF